MKTCLLASLLLALAVCSGASRGASPKIDENALIEMRKGQTTFDEIVRRFGRPNVTSKNWDGTRTAAYVYGEGRSAVALSLPALGAVLGGSNENTVLLYFDDRGRLMEYKVNEASAKPQDGPTVRYVEPAAAGPGSVVASTPARATTAAPSPAISSKPVPVEIRKPRKDDDLPWWLPSTSTREDRY